MKPKATKARLQSGHWKMQLTLLTQYEKAVDSLDPKEFYDESLAFLGNLLGAKNAFWLNTDDIDYYLQSRWNAPIGPGLKENVFSEAPELRCWKVAKVEQLSEMLMGLRKKLGAYWFDRLQFSKDSSGKHLVWIPVIEPKGKTVGYFLIDAPKPKHFERNRFHLKALVQCFFRHKKFVDEFVKAKTLNYVDDLTELYNQRYLPQALDKEISRAARNKEVFSVLFMDIDHFKRVNDSKGHIVGSKIIVEISKILRQNIRTTDYGFRYGGDEYILILIDTSIVDAQMVAERIRRQVEETIFQIDDIQIQVTLSIGIAAYPEHAMTREEIIALADQAMYYGKNKSRNVVSVAS